MALTMLGMLALGQTDALAQGALRPANDNIASAPILPLTAGLIQGNNVDYTAETNEPPHAASPATNSVWYRWTVPYTGKVTLETKGATFDTVIGVYTHQGGFFPFGGVSVEGLQEVAFNDDWDTNKYSRVEIPIVTAGTTLYIAIDGKLMTNDPAVTNAPPALPSQGSFTLSYALIDNDELASAKVLYGSFGSITGGNLGATKELGETNHAFSGSTGSNSVWFAWTAPVATNTTFTLTRNPTRGPTVLSVYQGSDHTTLTNITNGGTRVSFLPEAGQTYLIAVESATNTVFRTFTEGPYSLRWSQDLPTDAGLFSFAKPIVYTTDLQSFNRFRSGNDANGVEFTIVRNGGSKGRVRVDLTTMNGSATAGEDYAPRSWSVYFNDYQMSTNLVVPIFSSGKTFTNDFFVMITNVVVDPEPSPWSDIPEDATLVAAFDSTPMQVSINSTYSWIPNPRGGVISFARAQSIRGERVGIARLQVLRDGGDFTQPVSVDYTVNYDYANRVADGNNFFPLTPGSDYAYPGTNYVSQGFGGTVTIPALASVATIDIPILDTPDVEQNLDIYVFLENNLGSPNPRLSESYEGYILGGQRWSILTILSDDQPAGALDRTYNVDRVPASDPPFNTKPGANNGVYALAIQSDQKTIIGGDFTAVNTHPAYHISRLNRDGSLDTSFNTGLGADNFVSAIALQPDGRILIAGGFSSVNGTSRNGIARLNTNGSLDTSFDPGAGINPGNVANRSVQTMVLQPDGKVIIGGSFDLVNGVQRAHLARLNSNGTLDEGFDAKAGANGTVFGMALQADGKLVVGGAFTQMDGLPFNRIARLNNDGTVDTSFNPRSGADDDVYSVVIASGGKVVLGGSFLTMDRRSQPRITRLLPDGAVDATFFPGDGANNSVYTVIPEPVTGKLLVGGLFTSFNGTRRMGVARLYENGVLDTTFADTAYNQFAGLVKQYSVDPDHSCFALGVEDNGNIMVGGSFELVGGGTSRTDVRYRLNVTRLVGGETPGPGNFQFTQGEYTMNESGSSQFVTVTRDNGGYGEGTVFFSTADLTALSPDRFTSITKYPVTWTSLYTTDTSPFLGRKISDAVSGSNYMTVGSVSYNSDRVFTFTPDLDNLFVSIKNDRIAQGNQSFQGKLTLGEPTLVNLGGIPVPIGLALGRQLTTITIVDDDVSYGLLGFAQTNYSALENANSAQVKVVRNSGTVGKVSISYSATVSSATNGAKSGIDFVPVTGTLKFEPGQTESFISVPLLDDVLSDGVKIVNLTLSQPSGGALTNGQLISAILTIEDNDPLIGTPAGSVNTAFSGGADLSGANKQVVTVVYMDNLKPALNGRWMVGGDFTAIDGVPRFSLARLNLDGTVDSTTFTNFSSIKNGSVNAIAIYTNAGQPSLSGRIMIGGSFTAVNNTNHNHISRLNEDGSIDASFNPGSGADNSVMALAIQSDGRVIIAGDFGSYNGGPAVRVARLLPNGVLDTTFNVRQGPNNLVRSVAIDKDGKILIAGDFTAVDGQPYSGVARLKKEDGTLDTTFSLRSATDLRVRSVSVDSNGNYLMGGEFTKVGGVSSPRYARLTPNGELDSTFVVGTGANAVVYAIAPNPATGTIMVVGDFTTINGSSRTRIARLSLDGKLDPTINLGTGPNGFVSALAMQPAANGAITIVGGFTEVDGFHRNRVAQLVGGNNAGSGEFQFLTSTAIVSESAVTVEVTVRRTGGLTNMVSVNYSTVDGTARSGVDYVPAQGTLVFAQAEAVKSYIITLIENQTLTSDLILTNVLSHPTNYISGIGPVAASQLLSTNGPIQQVMTILNDDSLVEFTVPNYTANENAAGGFATITLHRLGSTVGTVSVSYSTSNLTAVAGVDYVQSIGNVIFTNGQSSAFFLVPVLNNDLVDGGRSLNLALSNPIGNVQLGLASASLNILDEDISHGTLVFAAPSYTVSESGKTVELTVIRTNGSSGLVSVQFQTVNASALGYIAPGSAAGFDYTNTVGRLVFSDGETIKTIQVGIIDDNVTESGETFDVFLSDVTGSATLNSQSATSVTVVDDDFPNGQFVFTQPTYLAYEQSNSVSVSVLRRSGTEGTVSVEFITANGSAIEGEDFNRSSGLLIFTPGESLKTFKLLILDDQLVETNESFNLTLFNPVGGATIGQSNTTVTIVSDDNGPGSISFASANFFVQEGATNAQILFVRTNGASGKVSVNFITTDLRATQPADYTAVSAGKVTFEEGQIVATNWVAIQQDSLAEGNETLQLTIFGPTGLAGLGLTESTLTILDDDLAAGSLDGGFGNSSGFNLPVNALLEQADGRILVAGEFTSYGTTSNLLRLARLSADGQLDANFKVIGGIDGTVRALSQMNDGRIVIGGFFQNVAGLSSPSLARITQGGGVDPTFQTGSGPDNAVLSLFTQANGKTIIGGLFTRYNGLDQPYLARVNANGQLDISFAATTRLNGQVNAIAQQIDGKILIAGDFTRINGAAQGRVARLNADGSVDTSFSSSLNVDNTVRALLLQNDGRILIAGSFTNVNATVRNYIARLNSEGSLDASFDTGLGANGYIGSIALQPDGKILAAGGFISFQGLIQNRIVRLNPNGSLDTSINFGEGANDYISTLLLQAGGQIVVGGGFTQFNNSPAHHVARLGGGINLGAGSPEFSAPLFTVSEDRTNVVVKVIRTGGTTGNVTVDFSTADSSGIAGTDYTQTIRTLEFVSGEVTKLVKVPVLDNAKVQTNRSITLKLTNPTGGAALGNQEVAVVRIEDNDSFLEFSSATYSVNKSGALASIQVVRHGGTLDPVSVDYFVVPEEGTATPGEDYQIVAGTLIFGSGVSTQSFVVPIVGNTLVQGDQTVFLSLSNATSSASLGTLTNAVLTIVENRFAPGTLAFTQAVYFENERDTVAKITVVRTNGFTGAVSVFYSTADGTATAGLDYEASTGRLAFADGETSKTFDVIIHSGASKADQTVLLKLSAPAGGASLSANDSAILTIISDTGVFSLSQAEYTVNEAGTNAAITVLRSGAPSTISSSVVLSTLNGTAIAGSDYAATNVVLVFAPGETNKVVLIPIFKDNLGENTEAFTVTLTSPSGKARLGEPALAQINITDDDVSFSFESTIFSVNETSSSLAIRVNRIGLVAGTVSVDYASEDGTALAGLDYVTASGTLTFTNGETSKTFFINLKDDKLAEGDETFRVHLLNATGGANIGVDANAVVTILDDEGTASFTQANYGVNEGNGSAVLTIRRSGNLNAQATVAFSTAPGTATVGADYTPTNGIVTFNALESVKNIIVPIANDELVEGIETFTVTLSSPSSGLTLLSPSVATVSIQDNDISFSFSSTNYTVLEDATNVTVQVHRKGNIAGIATVLLVTSNGTALAGLDYLASTNLVEFGDGETNKAVVIDVSDDLVVEGSETFQLLLVGGFPTNAVLGPIGKATVTITDNDSSKIVAAGSAIYSESGTANRLIEAGETVSIGLGLSNIGNVDTTNLVAHVAAVSGATISAGSMDLAYGAVVAGAGVVTRPIGFTVTTTNGGKVTLTLQLNDGSYSLGSVTYSFIVGSATYRMANTANILINDAQPFGSSMPASPYPAGILVTNTPGTITKLTVKINNLSHGFDRDIDMLLVGPNGANVLLMSDAGTNASIDGVTLTFDDAASAFLPANAKIVSGTYRPTNYGSIDQFTNITATTGFGTALSTFNGTSPNGTWSLYVVDDLSSASGNINGGWSIEFSTVDPLPAVVDLALHMTDSPDPVLVQGKLHYVVAVTNNGPATATEVYVTNTLPANATLSLAKATPADAVLVSTNSGQVVYRFPSLASGSSATVQLEVIATQIGTLTARSVVSSKEFDQNSGNNAASVKTTVVGAAAVQVRVQGSNLRFTWPAAASGFALYGSPSLSPAVWTRVSNANPVLANGEYSLTVSNRNSVQFFRLGAE